MFRIVMNLAQSISGRLSTVFLLFLALLLALVPAMALSRVEAASFLEATYRQTDLGPRSFQPAADNFPYGGDRASSGWAQGNDVIIACYPSLETIGGARNHEGASFGQGGANPAWSDRGSVVCVIERSVQPGETLSDVAALAGYPVETILELNPQYRTNPDLVQDGAPLVVPVQLQQTLTSNDRMGMQPWDGMYMAKTQVPVDQCVSSNGGLQVCVVEYTIQPGDTLLDIRARFGISIQELVEFNPQYLVPLLDAEAAVRPDIIVLSGRFGVSNQLSPGSRLLIPQIRPDRPVGVDQPTSFSDGDDTPSASDVSEALPALRLVRILPAASEGETVLMAGEPIVGDPIEYVYEVTNIGQVAVTNLTLINQRLELTCDATDLAASETATCAGTDTVSAGDVESGLIEHTFEAVAEVDGELTAPVSESFEIVVGPSEEAPDVEQQPDEQAAGEVPAEEVPAEPTADEPAEGEQNP